MLNHNAPSALSDRDALLLRPRAARGFTLIELMIAVAISTLVGILIYNVFIQQTQAYRIQSDIGALQQNLRVAMEMLSRDVSMAGWGTGHDGGSWGTSGTGLQLGIQDPNAPLYGLRIVQDFPLGSNRDAVEIAMMHPDRANWAWTDPDVQHGCGTNILTFHSDYAAQGLLFDSGTAAGTFSRIMCYSPVTQGRPGSWVWQVNGAAVSGQVQVLPGGENDFTANCPQNLPREMICAPAVYVAYYIDADSSDGVGMGSADLPVLYLVPDVFPTLVGGGYPTADDIPVALGIEDMQFELCEGGAGTTGTDCELASSWTAGYDPTSSVTDWKNLTSVRVHVVARTLRADYTRTGVSAAIDPDPNDGYPAVSQGADGYHRRVATTEVLVRNAVGTWQILNSGW